MKKAFKRMIALLLTTVMVLGCLPSGVFASSGETASSEEPVGKVWVKIEDTVPTPEGESYPEARGVMVEPTEVDLYPSDSAMDAVRRVCELKSIEMVISDNYINSIDGLGEFDRGAMSGWMVTINDWFTDRGLGDFTVKNGGLTNGDLITATYTLSYGTDVGSDWGNQDKSLKGLETDKGVLDPVFDTDVKAYTVSVPVGTTEIKVTPTATNKNYQVRASVNGTEYKRTEAIPVSEGTEIRVECGNPSWPSMNGPGGESQIYTLKVAYQNNQPQLAEGVVSPTEVKVGKDAAYQVDLNTIFTDLDGDALTFSVSIDGAEPVFANPNYTIKPDKNMTLVFKASDGKKESETGYEVKVIKTDNTAPVYKEGVGAYEETVKEIYTGGGGTSWSYFYPNKYFTDPEGDALTYYASLNGGEWEEIQGDSYRFTDQLGTFLIRFKASDGEFESPIHTVAFILNEASRVSIGCVPNDRLTGGQGYENFKYLYDADLSNVLQMTSQVTPTDRDQTVEWSLDLGQEYADIDASGKLTFKDNLDKNAYVRVVAKTADGKKAEKVVMFYIGGPKLKETETTLTLGTDGKEEMATKISMANSDFNNAVKVISSDENIVTATTSGSDIYLTPHRPGSTEVKVAAAWNENYYTVLKVNVKGVAVETCDAQASKIITLKKGEESTLALKAFAEDPNAVFTWSSSNDKVATVDENGVVTALSSGPVVITAKVKSEGVLVGLIDQVAPQQGAILLQVQGEGIPYFEDFQLSNFNMFGWNKNNDGFVAAQTEYELHYKPSGWSINYNWVATPVFDNEKYTAKVKYTDYHGRVKEAQVISGKSMTLTNILAPGNVNIEYQLTDKNDPENVTNYRFKVNTIGTANNLITRLNLYPNIDGVQANAKPTHEGKAEGTLFQVKDGQLGSASFSSNVTEYKAFVFEGTDQITLNPTFQNVYERVRLVVDDQTVGELKSATLTDPVTLNESETTVIKLQVVSSETYLTKTANGEDPYATPEKVYTITVERVKPADGDMQITSAKVEKGTFYAPGFNPRSSTNNAMIDFGTETVPMTFTVPNGYKVYDGKVAEDKLLTGTTGDAETTYKVETAFDGNSDISRTIVLKNDATGATNEYKFNFMLKGDRAYIPTEVTEYLCLGSQYTNAGNYGAYPEKTLTGIKSTGGNMGGSILSMGNFGGHIVYRFDEPVLNDPKNPNGVDFIVAGNSFGGAGASEPGNVEVSKDGTTWYTLAGSMHYDDEADWQYQMTYTNENGSSAWSASDGTSGTNYQYPKASVYPYYQWNQDNRQQITVSGLRLVSNSKDPYGSASAAYPDFGYVDTHKNGNYGEATNPYVGEATVQDGMFDLEWAVDSEGNPVELDEVHYVRISSASNIYAGSIGEKSTEVQYIAKTMNAAESAVGVTSAPEKIVVDTTELKLTEGQKSYEAAVHDSFDVRVNASEGANVYINGERVTEKHFDAVPMHGKIRIIVQEGEKEPVIYVVTLKDFTTDGANQVIEQIEKLPEIQELDITDKDAVNQAKAAFDSLNEEQKLLVSENLQTKLNNSVLKIAEIEEKIAVVTLKIQAMPEVKDLNLGYETYVNDTKGLYDALTEPQKAMISGKDSTKLTEAVNKIAELRKAEDDRNAAAQVDAQIRALPEPEKMDLSDKDAVIAAREAYNALTVDQKKLVKEVNRLEKAEERIVELEKIAADQEAAKKVQDQIDALPSKDDLALTDKATVETARAAYNLLTKEQQAYVTNIHKLEEAEARIVELEKAASDQEVAQTVIDMIQKVSHVTNLEQKKEVEAARAAYDKLTPDQKGYVDESTLKVLTDAEAKIAELEKIEADHKAAQEVADQIKALGNITNLEQKKEVEAARAAYDKLTPNQKGYVDESTLKVLTDAEAKIAEMEAAAQKPSEKPVTKPVQGQSGNTNGQNGTGTVNVVTGLTNGSQMISIVAVLVTLSALATIVIVVRRKKQ